MLIIWGIRYWDTRDREFKDRSLSLDTNKLPSLQKVAIELLIEKGTSRSERKVLKYRSLFTESVKNEELNYPGAIQYFGPADYFEDEDGNEITQQELGPILTGNPNVFVIPRGAKQHDIELILSEAECPPVTESVLSSEQIRGMGYFVRDLVELNDSAFLKETPCKLIHGGRLQVLPNNDYHLETAASDDEIRSYVTIFRRLYMAKEPANFLKATELFSEIFPDHPYGKWVKKTASKYEASLAACLRGNMFLQNREVTFTTKRLVDVYLYTQYAHQPDEKRQRQFTECLQQTGDKPNLMFGLFLTEIQDCGLRMIRASRIIIEWFSRYCKQQNIIPEILNSVRFEHEGLGMAEKADDRKSRLFREKTEQLEYELWKAAGKPEGGPVQYRLTAKKQLSDAMGSDHME